MAFLETFGLVTYASMGVWHAAVTKGLRWGTFTCVGWYVTVCDPIWQVTSRSSEMVFYEELHTALTFNLNIQFTFNQPIFPQLLQIR